MMMNKVESFWTAPNKCGGHSGCKANEEAFRGCPLLKLLITYRYIKLPMGSPKV